jgi:hypothetical protein
MNHLGERIRAAGRDAELLSHSYRETSHELWALLTLWGFFFAGSGFGKVLLYDAALHVEAPSGGGLVCRGGRNRRPIAADGRPAGGHGVAGWDKHNSRRLVGTVVTCAVRTAKTQ